MKVNKGKKDAHLNQNFSQMIGHTLLTALVKSCAGIQHNISPVLKNKSLKINNVRTSWRLQRLKPHGELNPMVLRIAEHPQNSAHRRVKHSKATFNFLCTLQMCKQTIRKTYIYDDDT